MRILITGATGLLGTYLSRELGDYHSITETARTEKHTAHPFIFCDITDKDSVKNLFSVSEYDAVIHCAASANVDQCQANPEMAYAVNVIGTQNIVRNIPERCRLVYISTDMVYSGSQAPHLEYSVSESPVNIYGMTKYLGEIEVLNRGNSIVLRTNFYGFGKSGLLQWIVNSLRAGTKINLYHDVYFSPLHIKTLTEIINVILRSYQGGTFNIGASNGMSKLAFGLLAASNLKLNTSLITPVSYSGTVPRPRDTRMNIGRAFSVFSLVMPFMESDLLRIIDDIRPRD